MIDEGTGFKRACLVGIQELDRPGIMFDEGTGLVRERKRFD